MPSPSSASPAPPVTASPEWHLLLLCARSTRTPERAEGLRALVGSGTIRWGRVLELAELHGLLPLLDRHLRSEPDAPGAPGSILDRLEAESRSVARRNLYLTVELVRLVEALEGAGIRSLAHKGPALTALAYPKPHLRVYGDLDVLVAPGDAAAAMRVLEDRGFAPWNDLTPGREAVHLREEYARPFQRDEGRVSVDLHWGFAKRFFGTPVPFERVWEGARTVSLHGRPVPTLGPDLLPVALAVHGTKHGPHPWPRVKWVTDMGQLLEGDAGIDWQRTSERARELGSERMLLLGVALAAALLGVELPAPLPARLRVHAGVPRLVPEVSKRLLAGEETVRPMSFVERTRFDLAVRERLPDRGRYVLLRALAPGHRDWENLELPPPLSFLYLPLRAGRLVGKYLARPWKLADLWRRSPEGSRSP